MPIPYLVGAYVVPEQGEKPTGFPFTLPFARTLNLKLDDRVTVFVGENGSGKSTIVPPSQGSPIIATHSPLIMSIAGAQLISLDGGELRPTKKEATAHWKTYAKLFQQAR